MKWHWKALIGICLFVLLVIIFNSGLNYWIKYRLPKIINRENDSVYHITYKNLEISLWDNTFFASEIIIIPKASLTDTITKAGIYTKIKNIKIENFKIWNLLFSNRIKAKSITIDHPECIFYKKKEANFRESVVAPFNKIISVNNVYLNHGDLKIIYGKNSTSALRLYNINLQLDGILITNQILNNKIPFEFRNYSMNCDSLYYHPNVFYHIKTKNIKATKSDLKIDHFEMIPEYSRREFVTKIPQEKDMYTFFCRSITSTQMNWGFKAEDFFFHCNVVSLDDIAANVFRSKIPPDNMTKKHLFSKMLRDLKFDLKIDTLRIRNSLVEFEEEKSKDIVPAKLTFNHFNVLATSVCSGFKKEKLPDLRIKIRCRFMKTSPLDVNWTFNVMDKRDGFNINGVFTDFNAENIAPFMKPSINAKAKGKVDVIYFNFTGNDKKASGDFAIKYDDVRFTIYQKEDRKKENILMTFVTNIIFKKKH